MTEQTEQRQFANLLVMRQCRNWQAEDHRWQAEKQQQNPENVTQELTEETIERIDEYFDGLLTYNEVFEGGIWNYAPLSDEQAALAHIIMD